MMLKTSSTEKLLQRAQHFLNAELSALQQVKRCIGPSFAEACSALLQTTGKVICTGMGKSGHIANKIAATFCSTGTPAFFIHPAEALHGDLGIVSPEDIILALSNSGETPEIITMLPSLKKLGLSIICITGNAGSTLARHSNVLITLPNLQEACPLGLAPTTSSVATLLLGDALALTCSEAKGFTPRDFARSHPGGILGKRLLTLVKDIMNHGDDIPTNAPNDKLADALITMSAKKLGLTVIINAAGETEGIFTDGDLRRCLKQGIDIHNTSMQQIIKKSYITIEADRLATEALKLMQDHNITALIVSNNKTVVGIIHIHDILKQGIT
jgi:arabinose-5-phosphate isomerase